MEGTESVPDVKTNIEKILPSGSSSMRASRGQRVKFQHFDVRSMKIFAMFCSRCPFYLPDVALGNMDAFLGTALPAGQRILQRRCPGWRQWRNHWQAVAIARAHRTLEAWFRRYCNS